MHQQECNILMLNMFILVIFRVFIVESFQKHVYTQQLKCFGNLPNFSKYILTIFLDLTITFGSFEDMLSIVLNILFGFFLCPSISQGFSS